MSASSLVKEEILRQADDTLYHMRVGGKESIILGRLILTNLRITFAEVPPRKRGLLGISGRGENLKPIINYKIDRLIRADVESGPPARQPAPEEPVTTDAQQFLVVYLNTPTGREGFAFEVPNPQEWSLAINNSTMAKVNNLPQQPRDVAEGSAREHIKKEEKNLRKAKETGRKKFCPECGKELELDTRFCWECGAEQPDVL